MRLSELLKFNQIVIQCHDNPDADALSSGLGVYTYFADNGKDVRFIYSGKYKIQKSNLLLMVEELKIPIEYVEQLDSPELLITVDCQYGQGNVTLFEAQNIAVIDHHQVSAPLPKYSEVRSNLAACATVVRQLLQEEGIDINNDKKLSTALYYGLLTDTNNFTEITHPLDKDLRDDASYERNTIFRFCNSNLSLKELEIAGKALVGYQYSEKNRYAMVKAEPCDPNILGMISDLVLEVDSVDVCVVYSKLPFGVKLSVRSCIKEVKACELVQYIVEGVGTGGGQMAKAGGFIQMDCLEQMNINGIEAISDFLETRMETYFGDNRIIYASEYDVDLSDMRSYRKKRIPLGAVKCTDIFPEDTRVNVRTLEGDLDITIKSDTYIVIGIEGEVYPNTGDKFRSNNMMVDEPYIFEGEYEPTIKDLATGTSVSVLPYAKTCISKGEVVIYARKLTERLKIFVEWDEEKYMLGKPGDYMAVREDNLHDIYIVRGDIFDRTYDEI